MTCKEQDIQEENELYKQRMALRFLAIYLSMLQVLQASTALNVKPGALTTHMGNPFMSQETAQKEPPMRRL
ncbi:hypothetical protein E2C01_013794 [Portunus trituberculatus]|uniref:Uncharacterized protein n=1 Tax=Portunus trituberculatus TaxID=210409 RepID=A0A5B7DIB5_PORTR|nr:hypothetical protein [Portunus trituberculatus]